MSWPPDCYLTEAVGDSPTRAPAVALRFAPRTPHPTRQGLTFVDWVKDLGLARWEPDAKRWVVCEFAGPDPAASLAAAGFSQVCDPQGWPIDLGRFRSVLVDLVPGSADVVAIYPRLVPEQEVRSKVGEDATWQHRHRRWVVPVAGHGHVKDPAYWAPLPVVVAPAVQAMKFPKSPARVKVEVARPTMESLRTLDLGRVGGLHPLTYQSLQKVGVRSVADILHVRPRRYIDRSNPVSVASVEPGEQVAFLGSVTSIKAPAPSARGRGITQVWVRDEAGASVMLRWFNIPRIARKYHVGAPVLVFGTMERFGGDGSRMTNPLCDVVGEADAAGEQIGLVGSSALIPVYPASPKADLSTWQVRKAVAGVLDSLGELQDPVPARLLGELGLVDTTTAWSHLHAPPSAQAATAAVRRLAYDELLRLQLALRMSGTGGAPAPGLAHRFTAGSALAVRDALPYDLTGAQRRVLNQIATDLAAPEPMHRLVQGDVGVGKTVVALLSALLVAEAGAQTVVLAPTEVLATQHHREWVELCGDRARVELLTAKSVTGKARKQLLADLAAGEVDIVVGTHALLSPKVSLANLGLVVVDEQHRFGVEQRHRLRSSRPDGLVPDLLVMTATPAPRTAAMVVFGDMAHSVLDEAPAGRSPVQTRVIYPGDPAAHLDAVQAALAAGRQAFVVAPLVGDSETKAAQGAQELVGAVAARFPSARVEVAHGKQKPAERADITGRFAAGDVDVLVATTAIEVGVNVPNATVIVITGAEDFGITQLHQLRGRVGRGQHPGRCYLIPSKAREDLTAAAVQRLEAVQSSCDGFVLAEQDLAIRGPGKLLSGVQAGRVSDLRFADLLADGDLVAASRRHAALLLAQSPDLAAVPALRAEVVSALGPEAGQWLRSS